MSLKGFDMSKDVKLIVKDTSTGMGKGLFTETSIPNDTMILTSENELCMYMNDPLFCMDTIRRAIDHEQLYTALHQLETNYYNEELAEEKVNVVLGVLGGNENGTVTGYFATKDIQEGEELCRVYGFPPWLFEIWEHLTEKNIKGYHRFLSEKTTKANLDLTLTDPIEKHGTIFDRDKYLYKMMVVKLVIDKHFEDGHLIETETTLGDNIRNILSARFNLVARWTSLNTCSIS